MKEQNQRLTMDIHKLTTDWTHAREMLEHKDRECDEKLKVRLMFCTFETRNASRPSSHRLTTKKKSV